MALSKKALQHKREKKKKKRLAKLPITLSISHNDWPIYESWMPINLWENGLGQVVIARKNSQDEIAAGIYLVDVFCLGIKNCFVRILDLADYKDLLENVTDTCGELKQVEPVYARTLIHKAVEYARQFGLEPHNDFAKAKNLLKNIAIDENQEFIFGQNGEPYYIPGPYESSADIRRIVKLLGSDKCLENCGCSMEAEHLGQLIEN